MGPLGHKSPSLSPRSAKPTLRETALSHAAAVKVTFEVGVLAGLNNLICTCTGSFFNSGAKCSRGSQLVTGDTYRLQVTFFIFRTTTGAPHDFEI